MLHAAICMMASTCSADVALAADVALPVDGRGARLQHGVADAQGAGVVGELLELAAGGDVDRRDGVMAAMVRQRGRGRETPWLST